MKQKITQLLIITIGTLALFTGCQEELKIGQERVIESSKRSQPNWVKRPPKANRKHVFFVGQDTSFENDNRYAYQMALSDVSSYISTKTNNLFKRTEQSLNNEESIKMRQSLIKNTSNAAINGAEKREIYWEKIEKLNEEGFKYFYKVYVLVAVSQDAIKNSQKATLQIEKEKQKEASNEEIKAMLNALQKELESEQLETE